MLKMNFVIRDIFRLKGNTVIKVISLALGLTVGVLLFSYNAYELSYDDFHTESERIYRVGFQWKRNDKAPEESPYSYAPVAATMATEMPEVENGTCIMDPAGKEGYKAGENTFHLRTIYADTAFFRFFAYPVLSGVPEEDLRSKDRLFLSRQSADRIFGEEDPVGQALWSEGHEYTVAGVFTDLPENTHLRFEVVKPLEVLKGSRYMDWGGGDAYYNYVRLVKGKTVAEIDARVPEMIRKYMGIDYKDCWFFVHLQPVRELYTKYGDQNVWSKVLLLSLLAFVVLVASALNYVLISVSSLAVKSRIIGVHKVNGAKRKDIFRMILLETLVLFVLACGLSVVILLIFHQTIEDKINVSLGALFVWKNLWVVGGVAVTLFLLSGVVPARIFSSVSVMQVFRQVSEGRRVWKRVLLGVQFMMAVFLITLLIVFGGQYNLLVNKDLGYNTEDLFFTPVRNTQGKIAKVKEELKRLACVQGVTVSTMLPFTGLSGNAVGKKDNREFLFSARWMEVDEDFLEVMEVPVIKGRGNREAFSIQHGAIVNEEFLRKMNLEIGETFLSDAGETYLQGVFRDFHIGSLYALQKPLMLEKLNLNRLSGSELPLAVSIRIRPVTPENLNRVRTCLTSLLPAQQPDLVAYRNQIRMNYGEVRYLRDVVMTVGVLAFAITVLGLIGFVGDEIRRRTKEIAIRKVNGATVRDVIGLLWREIGWMALFAMPVGLVAAFYLGEKWLEQFAFKLPLGIEVFAAGTIITLLVILITVTVRSYGAATANPVKSLKTE